MPLSHAVHCQVATCDMSAILGKVLISLCFCMQNLQPVISQLLTSSNTTEQRDGRRDTPLMLARKRGLDQVVDMLLTAGARDLPSSYSVAGCRVWAPGIYAFQSSSYTNVLANACQIKVATLTAANAKKLKSGCKCGNALQCKLATRVGSVVQCNAQQSAWKTKGWFAAGSAHAA